MTNLDCIKSDIVKMSATEFTDFLCIFATLLCENCNKELKSVIAQYKELKSVIAQWLEDKWVEEESASDWLLKHISIDCTEVKK